MKLNKFIIILCCLIATFSFFSCDDFEGEQTVPSYIRIKGFRMVPNNNGVFSFAQDSSFLTSDIIDAWLFVTYDNEQHALGCYSLEKNGDLIIPVLTTGRHYVEVRPGIKYNGMSATRGYYEFYSVGGDTLDLKEGEITDMPLQDIMYRPISTFAQRMNFEDNFNPFTNIDSLTNTMPPYMHIISNDSVAYGNKCAAFYSNSSSDEFVMITKDSITSTNHYAMILEMDYHSNIDFNLGIYGQVSSASRPIYIPCMKIKANNNSSLAANNKENWQKMYIILGKVWANLNYQPFKIWFSPSNSKGVSNGFVHIDNLKVIHFPE